MKLKGEGINTCSCLGIYFRGYINATYDLFFNVLILSDAAKLWQGSGITGLKMDQTIL